MTNSTSAEANQAFADLGLGPELVNALSALGYEEPTPIQQAAIPVLLEGTDLLGLAATGTGKTAAFALPMLERMTPGSRFPVGLILVPTRELAIQVAQAVHRYGKAKRVTVLPIYGGQSFGQQLKVLKRGVDVVVATPGRALDHLRRGTLDLGGLETLVLDEADEMLDMGFAEDLEEIRESVPTERQTLLFSATLSPRIEKISREWLKDAKEVRIRSDDAGEADTPLVRQTAYLVRRTHRLAALGRVLDLEAPEAALVFCRTRNDVDELVESLNSRGYRAEAMHGGMNQDERDRVMKKLRANSVDLLCATDVAARGLDIAHLTHVINYDVPSAAKSYVHRIGRVGRAGREGVAITLVDPREHTQLRSIERLTRQPIALESLPTIADLRARKLEMTRGAVRESLLEGGTERFRAVLESLTDEFDMYDIALGALKVAHEATSTESEEEDIPPAQLHREPGAHKKGKKGDRGGKTGHQKIKKRVSPGMARIFIGAGRLAGIKPGHIVGAITGEAGIRSTEVGSIQITDKFSLVEISSGTAEGVIRALRGSTIKGKKVKVKLDGGRG